MTACGRCGETFEDTKGLLTHPCRAKPVTREELDVLIKMMDETVNNLLVRIERLERAAGIS